MLVCKLPMHCRLQHKAKKKNHQRVSDSRFIVSVVMIPRSEKTKTKNKHFEEQTDMIIHEKVLIEIWIKVFKKSASFWPHCPSDKTFR